MPHLSFSRTVLIAITCLALIGCKSESERAQEYFESGMALVESGDIDRAIVQFRNVFEFDKGHIETRKAMARIYEERGQTRAVYQQYLAIAEQHPEDVDSRIMLSEITFSIGNWDELTRHGTAVLALAPEDPRVKAIDLSMKYREASLSDDDPALDALATLAESMLPVLPENILLNNILVDYYARNSALNKALGRIDVLLGTNPNNRQYYNRRLALLAQMQDFDGIEKQLRDMVTVYPDDAEVQGMMVRFYVSQQRMDQAESFLREIADPAAEDPSLFFSLIQFVEQVHGEEAARTEIERAVAVNPNPAPFQAMLAVMDFRNGQQEKAISDVEAILEAKADDPDADLGNLKVTLARMLIETGNQVGARRLVEEVLASGEAHVEALKLQAIWQLEADDTDAAIAGLRLALDNAPDDVQAMYLMHDTYIRVGDTDLARDFLAQAVDASGNAPEATLRYANVLLEEERYLAAEDVLLPSLRLNPGNVDLLGALGKLYVQMDDIPRASQVANTLERLDTEESSAIAIGLRASILSRKDGTDEAMRFLEQLAQNANASIQARLRLLQAQAATGAWEDALQTARGLVEENPDNLSLKLAYAQTLAATDDVAAAEGILREVTDAAPQRGVRAWLMLLTLQTRTDQTDAVKATLEEAVVATNRNANIMWAKASMLEREGDYDGAIEIYESLYETDPDSVVIANNLASMLTTYRYSPENLERAWIIARRLRDTTVPAFQDTYGWIALQRGNAEEALPYLKEAAAGLPNDPVVQVHLGMNYAALGRNQDAIEQLQRAIDLAGPADTRERIEEARTEITRLRDVVEN